jgi:hypothetical protein
VPGCRAPHFWLADGRSLYDAFGPGYTLLRLDAQADVTPLVAAAQARGMPLAVLDAQARDGVPDAYRHKLVLCRADQHVVWRGDVLPADAGALVAVLCGLGERAGSVAQQVLHDDAQLGRRHGLVQQGEAATADVAGSL